ncbi:hypothetical protein L2D08_09265 [Domibacillus sp. PGB-M46]|uniref:hypothetical protein n=1 Tax=Domibacillus sp. PGB-M46 TaxID=2910255 RepID=UPI001F573AA2|nr:hypothetical protein [Domibacillus sp. PGB-M46]MCI2254555.1 hypothetical protein [Domibacillus sp. PGB-M46]
MLRETIKVTSFSGMCYGHDGLSIKFTFQYESEPIEEFAYYEQGYGYYHLNKEDIILLSKKFEKRIPKIGAPYYKNKVTDWGYDVEEQLAKIMLFGLDLEREKDGELYLVTFKWVAAPWDAEKNRRKKRKFPRNPDLNW